MNNKTCHLEMRIYKKDITGNKLKPMLALHGGSWKNRGFGYFGLETGISHFTDRGFIVFAPFYRLTSSADGNSECNSASWREVIEDIEDALQWVADYGRHFGASKGKITVFGQSAGGHLAAWLTTHRPGKLRKAYLLYPPTDFLKYIKVSILKNKYQSLPNLFGLKSIASFYGSTDGLNEVRLHQIEYEKINTNYPEKVAHAIPRKVFNLVKIDMDQPPVYLKRCSEITHIPITKKNLSKIPHELLDCLQKDLSEFLVENSFTHQMRTQSIPLFTVHGTGDALVPYAQSLNLCFSIQGKMISKVDRTFTNHTRFTCSPSSQAHIIKGAQHILDLGLCVGDLCPSGRSGSPMRRAVLKTLRTGYEWATLDNEGVQTSEVSSIRMDMGEFLGIFAILLLISGIVRRIYFFKRIKR